jgi:23S rRNA pseudouridine1911/1915/1917 synthase
VEQVFSLTVEGPGQRLDRFLAARCPELSRSYLQRLVEEGQVTVNGHLRKPSYTVRAGDVVVVRVPEPSPVEGLAPEAIPLSVLYEDQDLLVIDKPPGMVVHPSPGHSHATLVNALLAYCPGLGSIKGVLRPGIVHRLDKDTSGLMVVAKTDAALQHLQKQFKERMVTKRYLALVRGRVKPAEGVINFPIGRDPRNRKKLAVVGTGRPAATRYRVVATWARHSLIEAQPLTGRTHQIRVHFSVLGHPVVGDAIYGGKSPWVERQFLHAVVLGFRMPRSGEYREFRSELPEDLRRALQQVAGAGADQG